MKTADDIFKERFLPLYPRLYAVAAAILGSATGEAADVVQEAMVRIWQSGEAMAKVDRPEPYAVAVVRAKAIDLLRSRHRQCPLDSAAELSADYGPDLSTAEFIHRIIDTLPASQREVVRLSAFNNMSTNEICDVTGLSQSNVRQLLSRGRKKIKELYTKYMQS